ncbi:MAG: class I SAM-dependent methyltransferase [Actinobacteria bacterium]|nr:class I SAM-dependent methyltransferase [Actinomycetota bacterium]
MWQVPADLAGNLDRLRWNQRYGRGYEPSFDPHPLAVQALALPLPDGPVLELAAGPSGSALLAAEQGRPVTAVDVSDAGLDLLAAEARRRHVEGLLTLVQADLTSWCPPPELFALVLCTNYWDRGVFAAASGLVAPGGLIAWEGFTLAARHDRPHLPAEWCLDSGEPASLLPAGFEVLEQSGVGAEPAAKRQMLARRLS